MQVIVGTWQVWTEYVLSVNLGIWDHFSSVMALVFASEIRSLFDCTLLFRRSICVFCVVISLFISSAICLRLFTQDETWKKKETFRVSQLFGMATKIPPGGFGSSPNYLMIDFRIKPDLNFLPSRLHARRPSPFLSLVRRSSPKWIWLLDETCLSRGVLHLTELV